MSKVMSFLLPTLLAGCSLIGGSHLPGVAPSAGMAPEVERSLNYITSNLDQAERALGSSDPHAAQVHLDSARSELDKLSPANRARPQFATAEARWKKLSGKDGDMASSQHKTELGHDALRDASAHHQEAKIGPIHNAGREYLGSLETRAKVEKQCVDMLDTAFKQDPNTAKLVYEGKTGQAIYDACKAKLAEVNTAHDQLLKELQDKEAAIVVKVYKEQWPKAEHFYSSAKKLLRKPDDFAIINANSDIITAVDQYSSVVGTCREVTQYHLETLQLDKAMTANAMCEQAAAMLAEAGPLAKDTQEKYNQAYDRLQQKIFASVHGDRARIMKQEGLPSWFDGADLLDSHEWFNAMLRSSYYRYDSSTGCQTTYYFSGNSLQRSKNEPLGCAG
jgi:hypothetical protein